MRTHQVSQSSQTLPSSPLLPSSFFLPFPYSLQPPSITPPSPFSFSNLSPFSVIMEGRLPFVWFCPVMATSVLGFPPSFRELGGGVAQLCWLTQPRFPQDFSLMFLVSHRGSRCSRHRQWVRNELLLFWSWSAWCLGAPIARSRIIILLPPFPPAPAN